MCDVSAVKTAPITGATNTAGATGGGDTAGATDLAALVPALKAVVTALEAVIQALGGAAALGGGAGGAPTAPSDDARTGSVPQVPPTQTTPPAEPTPPEQDTPPKKGTPPATPPTQTAPPTQAAPPATPPVVKKDVPAPPAPPTSTGGGAEAAPKAPGLTVAQVQRQTEQAELDRLTGIAVQKRESWSTLRDQINAKRESITKLQGAGAPSYAIQALQDEYDDMVVRQGANTDALQAADTDVKNYGAAHGF